ncbi:MAG: OB-fold nucleic acid binding domain-containing protein, partial [bacterium]
MENILISSFFKKLTIEQKIALRKINIFTLKDLLYHFPNRYGDTQKAVAIATLSTGPDSTVFGKISKLKIKKAFKSNIAIATATITDGTGSIKAVWFNQPYIAKMFKENGLVRISGPVSQRKEELNFLNPQIESVSKIPDIAGESLFGVEGEEHSLYPVYSESKGITSNWIYHSITKIFNTENFKDLSDPIPDEILQKYNLPSIKTALIWIHSPKKETDALAARKRFAFEEVFFIQLRNQIERAKQRKERSFVIKKTNEEIKEFSDHFPFDLTKSQNRAISEILKDISKTYPMSRLLEGDVGSGKTAVAATIAYGTVSTNPKGESYGSLQVAYMAPTEILAKQHFESF